MAKKDIFDDKQALRIVIRYRVGSRVQKEVAKKGGLDPTTMSQFASGSRLPRRANMEKLAKALDCTVPQLKAAIAIVLSVAETGGDEVEMRTALDRYFMGMEGDNVAAKVDRIADAKLQSLLKNLLKSVSELVSYLAASRKSSSE